MRISKGAKIGKNICCEYAELVVELEHCTEREQKRKIEEMNEVMDEMNKEELESVLTEELFNKFEKMIEEKKISLENVDMLLKHVGYCKKMKNMWVDCINESLLNKRFEKMIIDENEKKEGKNESLLVDLCECSLLLNNVFNSELKFICVPCLLKVVLKKEENEETQIEVEMALLALSCIELYDFIEQEPYLNEIKEIIKYHQKHHNLTRLAYQCAWEVVLKRYYRHESLIKAIINEYHYVREATRELEEMKRCVDWKRMSCEQENQKNTMMILKWLRTISFFLFYYSLKGQDNCIELIACIVGLFKDSNENYEKIADVCIEIFGIMIENTSINEVDLIRNGAVQICLDEIVKTTSKDYLNVSCLRFFEYLFKRLNKKLFLICEEYVVEANWNLFKRKAFIMCEEEGYEDVIFSYCCSLIRNPEYIELMSNDVTVYLF
ncbi:uncharacterized protein MONOS_18652 [Monocercomonoides exilis]|uniref:uncharacterized protein n=1 Tax=Monocercomonoides exilis TaxID=2049356 RepID=UPI00355A165C|nr:hypothetical protein MONOS_18652 [Monocercomonoides exilis]